MALMEQVPELVGDSVQEVKAWCRSVADLLGGGWHADDSFGEFGDLSIEASERLNRYMDMARLASRTWKDPDFLYSLAGEGGRFIAEEEWPGFEIDVSVPAAERTGYQIWRGQPDPTIVVEDMDRFFAVSFPGEGPLSARRAVVAEIEGAEFDLSSVYRRGDYIDTAAAVRISEQVEVSGIGEVEAVIGEFLRVGRGQRL